MNCIDGCCLFIFTTKLRTAIFGQRNKIPQIVLNTSLIEIYREGLKNNNKVVVDEIIVDEKT